MSVIVLKRVVSAFFRTRHSWNIPEFSKRLELTNFPPPSSFLASFTMPPKRKAVLEAHPLEPDSPSPKKQRKVSKKPTKKQPVTKKTDASSEKQPETVNKVSKLDSPVPEKQKKVTRKRTKKAAAEKVEVPTEEQPKTAPEPDSPVPKRKKATRKPAKKAAAEKTEAPTEEQHETLDKAPEPDSPVPEKRKKATRKPATKKKTESPSEEEPESTEADDLAKNAKRGKQTEGKETKPVLLNVTDTNWEDIDFGCNKKNPNNKGYNLKVTSWNVDGLRAWLKKNGMKIIEYDQPDILCLQETKCGNDKLPKEVKNIPGYHDYWMASEKDGYAGVAVYTKILPENVVYGIGTDQDKEGRCITLEFESFFLVNVYVPNAGRGLVTLPKRLEWNEQFKKFIKNLDNSKPVILCGDMNVAHTEIDLTNPKTNQKNAGFTIQEREGMTEFLQDGYIDTYRHLYPKVTNSYTFWSYMSKARAKNVGWRLDYFIVSKRLKDKICDSVIRSQVFGSDHCPISLFISV